MTNGIELNQLVRVKANGKLGEVIGIDDHTERLPADLQLRLSDGTIKVRVDEVETLKQFVDRMSSSSEKTAKDLSRRPYASH